MKAQERLKFCEEVISSEEFLPRADTAFLLKAFRVMREMGFEYYEGFMMEGGGGVTKEDWDKKFEEAMSK